MRSARSLIWTSSASGWLVKINGMAEDLDAGAAHDVARGVLVAFGVDQVAAAQAEDGAVGE